MRGDRLFVVKGLVTEVTMPTTFDPQTGLTPAQAARRLQVTPQWVVQLADAGRLRSCRTPLGRLIDPAAVEAFAAARAARRQQPGGAPDRAA